MLSVGSRNEGWKELYLARNEVIGRVWRDCTWLEMQYWVRVLYLTRNEVLGKGWDCEELDWKTGYAEWMVVVVLKIIVSNMHARVCKCVQTCDLFLAWPITIGPGN